MESRAEIPPTAVGGMFRSGLHSGLAEFTNPTNGSWWMVQIEPVRPYRGPMKLNLLFNALGSFVSEDGSEQSTNCPLVGFKTRFVVACRLNLKHPPTAVGGISALDEISDLLRGLTCLLLLCRSQAKRQMKI